MVSAEWRESWVANRPGVAGGGVRDNAGADTARWGPRHSLPQGGLEWPPHKHTSHFNALSSNSSKPAVSLKQPGEVGVTLVPVLQMGKSRAREETEVAEPMEDLRILAPYLELSPPQRHKRPSKCPEGRISTWLIWSMGSRPTGPTEPGLPSLWD